MLKAAESASNKVYATWMHMKQTAVLFDEDNHFWKMYLKKEEEVLQIAQKIVDIDAPHPAAQNATSNVGLI